MPLPDLVKIVRKNISKKSSNAFPNGIITLKGGELQSEIQSFRNIIDKTELTSYFEEEWFKEKFVLYLPN
jgi:16S rRNA (guanine527-N7)-methyltransferase